MYIFKLKLRKKARGYCIYVFLVCANKSLECHASAICSAYVMRAMEEHISFCIMFTIISFIIFYILFITRAGVLYQSSKHTAFQNIVNTIKLVL